MEGWRDVGMEGQRDRGTEGRRDRGMEGRKDWKKSVGLEECRIGRV